MKTKEVIASVLLALTLTISEFSGTASVKAMALDSTLSANEIVDKTLGLGFYKSDMTDHSAYFNPYGSDASRGYDLMNIWAYNGESDLGGPNEFEIGMTIGDRNPELNAKIKTIFNWLLPTKGNHFYNILDDPQIYPKDYEAKGKDMWAPEQQVLLDSYGFQYTTNHTSNKINLSITLDGRHIQIEFSNWTPLFISFGPAETNGIRTGWKYIDDNYSYFDSNGVMQKNWLKLNNKWYYLGKDGTLKKGWQLIDSKWYYFGYSGYMYTGWLRNDNVTYYLGSDGSMKTGWQLINSKWFYFNSTGVMQTGWCGIDGKWYYFTPYDSSKDFGEYGNLKTN